MATPNDAQFLNIFTGISGIGFDNLAISNYPAGVGLGSAAPVNHRIPDDAFNDLTSFTESPIWSRDGRTLSEQSNAHQRDAWMARADEHKLAVARWAPGGVNSELVVDDTECCVWNGINFKAISSTLASISVGSASAASPVAKLQLPLSQGFNWTSEHSLRYVEAAFATDEL